MILLLNFDVGTSGIYRLCCIDFVHTLVLDHDVLFLLPLITAFYRTYSSAVRGEAFVAH